jgi:hypothetical protein
MSNYHLDVKLTIWERYEFESEEQMLEAKTKLESGELVTTDDVSSEYDLSATLLVDTAEELDLLDNNDQPTMEIFREGVVIWKNADEYDED